MCIRDSHAACADAGVISDKHRAQHLGACADKHVVAQGGVAFAGILAGTAQRYSVVDGAVIPNLAGLTEHDAHAVVDKQTLADGGTRVDLNAGAVAAMLADPPCQKKVLVLVQPVRDTVIHQNVESRVQQHYLQHAACGGVLALDVPRVLK